MKPKAFLRLLSVPTTRNLLSRAGLLALAFGLAACSGEISGSPADGAMVGDDKADANMGQVCQQGRDCCTPQELVCSGNPDDGMTCRCDKIWECDAVLNPAKCEQAPPAPAGVGDWNCTVDQELERCEKEGGGLPDGSGGWSCRQDNEWIRCERSVNTPGGGGTWNCRYDGELGRQKKTCERPPEFHFGKDAGVDVDRGTNKDQGVGPDLTVDSEVERDACQPNCAHKCQGAPNGCGDFCTQNSCELWESCDNKRNCTYVPSTRNECSAHIWWMGEKNGVGGHADTYLPCSVPPDYSNAGSNCSSVVKGNDIAVSCQRTTIAYRTYNAAPDFLTHYMSLQHGINNPAGIKRCLLAWGIIAVTRIETRHLSGPASGVARGKASDWGPVRVDSTLYTTLPKGVLTHHVLMEPLPSPKEPVPITRGADRLLRFIWKEPSAASVQRKKPPRYTNEYSQEIQYPTYEALTDWVVRNEVYGETRGPDTIIVHPFYLPYYDQQTGQKNHFVLQELVCEAQNGAVFRRMTGMAMPYRQPTSFPATF